jgi:hypothetical protein
MDEVTAPKSKPKSADASVLPTIAGASYSEECSDGSRTAGTVSGDTKVVEPTEDDLFFENVRLKTMSSSVSEKIETELDQHTRANAQQTRCVPSWCSCALTLVIVARSMAIMSYVMWNEVISIWCMTPLFRGGLQWSARGIGQVWGVAGVFMAGCQLWLMPLIMNSVGTWRAIICGALLNIPTLGLLPWIALTQEVPEEARAASATLALATEYAEANTLSPTAFPFVLLFCLMCTMNITGQMLVIGTTVFIGNSVTTEYRARATAFGVGIQSLFMALAPTLGGLLFTWGIEKAPFHSGLDVLEPLNTWPFGCHPTFLVCSLIQIPVACMAVRFPKSLEHSPEDKGAPEVP